MKAFENTPPKSMKALENTPPKWKSLRSQKTLTPQFLNSEERLWRNELEQKKRRIEIFESFIKEFCICFEKQCESSTVLWKQMQELETSGTSWAQDFDLLLHVQTLRNALNSAADGARAGLSTWMQELQAHHDQNDVLQAACEMKDQGWTLKQHYASQVVELKSAKEKTEQQGTRVSEEQQKRLQGNLDKQATAEMDFTKIQKMLDEARRQAATSEKELRHTLTEIIHTICAWLIFQGSAIASTINEAEKEHSKTVAASTLTASVDPGAPLKAISNVVISKPPIENSQMKAIVGDLELMLDVVPFYEADNSLEDCPPSPDDMVFTPPERAGVLPGHGWRKYDRVQVWSKSQQTWIPDGIVSNVATADVVLDGHTIPAHSVKVSYNGGMTKWVAAKDASSELRRAPKPISDSDQVDSMANLAKGAQVEVWSRSKNAWISDCTVLDIATTDIALDGYIIPAGSVKVGGADLVKWVAHGLRAVELRAAEQRAVELGIVAVEDRQDVLAVISENLSKDARVDVWSNSQKTWIPDGQVLQVLNEDTVVEGHKLSAGSVKVSYGAGNTKWLPLDLVATQLRRQGEPRSSETYRGSLPSVPGTQRQKPYVPQPSLPGTTKQYKAQMPKVDSTSRDVRAVMHCLLEDMEQECTSPPEKRARLLKKMVAEWHPDKRPQEEYHLATRVCQWLNGPARCFAR